jgi:hypothetical protein
MNMAGAGFDVVDVLAAITARITRRARFLAWRAQRASLQKDHLFCFA